MIVMGLNGWTERGHDGGASVVADGKVLFAVEEEKLICKKHAYDTIPKASIKESLKYCNLSLDDIDAFYIGWNYNKLYEMLNKKFISNAEMSKELFGTDKYKDKIHYVDHHIAHAYSTFIPSGYKEAIVLVIDGQGEYMGTSIFAARENRMKLLMETPISLGYFYAGITKHVGFRSGEEGKTMGLASYGEPIYIDSLKKLIYLDDDCNLKCVFHIDKVSKDEEDATLEKWEELLNTIILKRESGIETIDDSVKPYANLAISGEKLLEEILCKLAIKYVKEENIHNICIAGGVGLNCPAISKIENLELVDSVFVQPAANDGGLSLGAAIKGDIDMHDDVKYNMSAYLGPEYTNEEIEDALKNKNYKYEYYDNIAQVIAKLLSDGNIVANFQGRLEFGPRALGNRSLLADPRKKSMLVKLNNLKGREVWRPLAPAVLYDKQEDYFDSNIFSPFMTKNFNVLDEKKDKVEAIIHVDETARVQSVTKENNKLFYDIINSFYKITGIPMVINTSFNVKGEPIVCTPTSAIESFEKMHLDYLAIGNYLIRKK